MANPPLDSTEKRCAAIVALPALLLFLCIGGCQPQDKVVIYDHGKPVEISGEKGAQLAAKVVELARTGLDEQKQEGGVGALTSYVRNHGLVIEVALAAEKGLRRGAPDMPVESLMLILSHPLDASACEPPILLFGGRLPMMIRIAAWMSSDPLSQSDDLGLFYFSSHPIRPNLDDFRKNVAELLYSDEVAALSPRGRN